MPSQDDYVETAERLWAEVWRDSWGPRLNERHRAEWPDLWAALDHLTDLVGRDIPADRMGDTLF